MFIGSTDICWRGRVFDLLGIFSLSLFLSQPPFPFLSRFFYVPSEPHAHGYARLKNMEPVWPEWLLWKSSGLPDGLNPTQGGSYERKILSNNRVSSLRLSERRYLYRSVPFSFRFHRLRQYYDLKNKKEFKKMESVNDPERRSNYLALTRARE